MIMGLDRNYEERPEEDDPSYPPGVRPTMGSSDPGAKESSMRF